MKSDELLFWSCISFVLILGLANNFGLFTILGISEDTSRGIPVNQLGKPTFFEGDSVQIDNGPFYEGSDRYKEFPKVSGDIIFVNSKIVKRDVMSCPGGYDLNEFSRAGYNVECRDSLFSDAWLSLKGYTPEGAASNYLMAGWNDIEWISACNFPYGNGPFPYVCSSGYSRVFVQPRPCSLDEGEFIVVESFDAGATVTKSSLKFVPSKFCSAHPVVVFDTRSRLSYTDAGITARIRDGSYTVPSYQGIYVYYITNVHNADIDIPCEGNKAYDISDSKCKDVTGFVSVCKGTFDSESGICYEQLEVQPKCPRGSYYENGGCWADKSLECSEGEPMQQGDVWVCILDPDVKYECSGKLVESDGGWKCVVAPETVTRCPSGSTEVTEGGVKKCAVALSTEKKDSGQGIEGDAQGGWLSDNWQLVVGLLILGAGIYYFFLRKE